MRTSHVDRVDWAPTRRRQTVEQRDGTDEALLVAHDGQPVIAQVRDWIHDADDLALLRRYLRYRLNYVMMQARLSGIRSMNQWYGTVPPQPTRRRYPCAPARLYAEVPEFKPLIERVTQHVVAPFAQLFPDAYRRHDEVVRANIHSDWLIADTPFTSGIINHTAALPYHKDSGNLQQTWSVMLSLRAGVDGGRLHIPEYDVTLDVPDASLIIFNGTEAWHGVTPLVYRTKDAYRFTLVWYVKERIRQCGCAADEARRSARYATQRHDEHAQPQ